MAPTIWYAPILLLQPCAWVISGVSGTQPLIFSPVRFNLTGMRETLTVSLPPRTKRLIARAATESGLTTSEYVRMAIHRKLWQDAVAEARRVAVPRARARGFFTDEDIFALIS
jgi:uncharacterized protein (DUF1778 family)